MQNIIQEFQRLSGVAPSFLERAAADPMLGVLAKAFSVKTVKPADVKYLLYRKVGKGVELEDKASKFGDILTSVEPRDADPKTLVAFLKKHGAKPAPKVEELPWDGEPLVEMQQYGLIGKPHKDAVKKGFVNLHLVHPKNAKMLKPENLARFVLSAMQHKHSNVAYLKDPQNILGKSGMSMQQLKKDIAYEWEAFFHEEAMYAQERDEWEAASKYSSMAKMMSKANVQLAPIKGKTGASGYRVTITPDPHKLKVESIEEAKSSFDIEVIHAKSNPEVVKVDVTGSFRGEPIHGKSRQIHLGIETMKNGWVTLGDYLTINRPDSGKKVPDGFKTKILKAALAKLVPLAHKIGNKEFAESIEEGVAQTILKQMGGPGRLKAMLGAKHFIDHGKALSFQFPNRKRSKGNVVKITLRSDDTYDMEFSAISGGGTKVKKVKTYSGITFDQLQPLFTEWTGLYLSL